MTQTTTARFIGKCSAGHTVNGTDRDFVANCKIRCGCGLVAIVRCMTVRITDHECGVKCTSALGPVCDCTCGGENHGADHRAA